MEQPAGKSSGGDRFAALKGKLLVIKPVQWDEAIGMEPAEFYDLWTRDLPGEITIFLELTGGGQGKLMLTSRDNGKVLFEAEREFDRPRWTMNLEEASVKDVDMRRKGIGKILFDNQLALAEKWGIRKFTVRAGREDGPYYWSRRGAYLADEPHTAEERKPVNIFRGDIEKGLAALAGTLEPEFAAQARKALDTAGCHANCVIARLPGSAPLFKHVMPFRAAFDLDNAEQMALVREGLAGVARLRESMPHVLKSPVAGQLQLSP